MHHPSFVFKDLSNHFIRVDASRISSNDVSVCTHLLFLIDKWIMVVFDQKITNGLISFSSL